MAPYISQNEILQHNLKTPSHYVSLQSTNIQNEAQQENKKQSKENESVEELDVEGVDTKKTEFRVSNITSSPTGSPSGSMRSTEQEVIKPMKIDGEEINSAAKALATVMGIEPIKGNINKEVEVESSDIQDDEIYEKREIKPRLIAGSSDINYEKDKGGNHRMVLMYCSDNSIRFSKDDDPVIIIKNDNVKNEGDYWRFVTDIRKWCKQNKKYFEDYLKDHGFMKKEEERIVALKKANEIIAAYRNSYIKKFGGIIK